MLLSCAMLRQLQQFFFPICTVRRNLNEKNEESLICKKKKIRYFDAVIINVYIRLGIIMRTFLQQRRTTMMWTRSSMQKRDVSKRIILRVHLITKGQVCY